MNMIEVTRRQLLRYSGTALGASMLTALGFSPAEAKKRPARKPEPKKPEPEKPEPKKPKDPDKSKRKKKR